MKMWLYSMLVVIATTTLSYGQEQPSTLWFDTYGAPGAYDEFIGLEVNSNGEIVLAGKYTSLGEIHTMRVSSDGEQVLFDHFETEHDAHRLTTYYVTLGQQDNLIISGYAWSGITFEENVAQFSVQDPNGNLIHQYQFTSVENPTDTEIFTKTIQTADGGYVSSGVTYNNYMWIHKCNSNGVREWQYVTPNHGWLEGIKEIDPNVYVAFGWGGVGLEYDGTAIKLIDHLNGTYDVTWEHFYPSEAWGDDGIFAIDEFPDGSLVLVGNQNQNHSSRIMRIDQADGDVLWDVLWLPEGGEGRSCKIWDVTVTQDGGIAMCGKAKESENQAGHPLVLKFSGDGVYEWSYMLDYQNDHSDARSISEVAFNEFVIGGQYGWDPINEMDFYVAKVVDPIRPVQNVTIMGPGNEEALLRWEDPYPDWPVQKRYYIYWADYAEGPYTQGGFVDDETEATVSSDYDLRFYVVVLEYGQDEYTPASIPVGLIRFDIPGSGTPGVVSLREFGLPFKFWNVNAGVPEYGNESFKPSSIVGAQTTPGNGVTADRIGRLDNGFYAYRTSLVQGNPWTASLETTGSGYMLPAHVYEYINKTGYPRTLTLFGQVNNGSTETVTIIGPAFPATYMTTPYSWRDAREPAISDLGLLEAGFTGGTSLSSDRVSEIGGLGRYAYFRTSDNTWQGTLYYLEVGAAYNIINRHDTWTYTYTAE